jgi:hypothetical protein
MELRNPRAPQTCLALTGRDYHQDWKGCGSYPILEHACLAERSKRVNHAIKQEDRAFSGFSRITAAGLERGLDVQHFVISSGLREMIDGTSIRKYLRAVFASGFLYNASGVAAGPAMAVNYTTKTQFLFRINKGASDVSDDQAVNAFVPQDQRPVPFRNITFIGDGDTDIPCFPIGQGTRRAFHRGLPKRQQRPSRSDP